MLAISDPRLRHLPINAVQVADSESCQVHHIPMIFNVISTHMVDQPLKQHKEIAGVLAARSMFFGWCSVLLTSSGVSESQWSSCPSAAESRSPLQTYICWHLLTTHEAIALSTKPPHAQTRVRMRVHTHTCTHHPLPHI